LELPRNGMTLCDFPKNLQLEFNLIDNSQLDYFNNEFRKTSCICNSRHHIQNGTTKSIGRDIQADGY
jgi:hypothetical protein